MIKDIIFIFFLESFFIVSSPLYEIYPEEQILLNHTKDEYITFDVKAKEPVNESFTISCFENIGFRIEGPYDTVWKTLKGSVVFQEGEKANTIKKLQCYPS